MKESLSLMERMGLIKTSLLRKKFKFLNEGVFKSYEASDIYKILNNQFTIGSEQDLIEKKCEIGIAFDTYIDKNNEHTKEISVILIIVPINFKKINLILNTFKVSGWTLAGNYNYYKDSNYCVYAFEKDRQTETIAFTEGEKLYHITPSSKVNKILKNGLTPHAGNKLSVHPERIYFMPFIKFGFSEKVTVINIANSLYAQNLRKECKKKNLSELEIEKLILHGRDIKYSVLEVDISKCNENIEFYGDPNADGAVWTYDNIPPQAINVILKDI